jgi:hypothetical protein
MDETDEPAVVADDDLRLRRPNQPRGVSSETVRAGRAIDSSAHDVAVAVRRALPAIDPGRLRADLDRVIDPSL